MKKHTFMFLFLSVWTRSDTTLASQSFLKHVDDEFYQTEEIKFSVMGFSSRCTQLLTLCISWLSFCKEKYLLLCDKSQFDFEYLPCHVWMQELSGLTPSGEKINNTLNLSIKYEDTVSARLA